MEQLVTCCLWIYNKVISFHVDAAVVVIVDSNHVDIPDVHVYDGHDLASPDNDQLHLPVVSDAPRTAGLYLANNSSHAKTQFECHYD